MDESLRDALAAIVGPEHVAFDEAELAPHRRTLIPSATPAAAVVMPGSTEEVQRVVRLANQRGLPLWPAGGGRNWGYGARSPALAGTVVLLLHRLNRILHVDAELAYAVIEPGVTYLQLHQYLQDHDLGLCVDPTDSTPHGSVIGNALERGVGETPYGDHFGNLCGLEVVTPEGERFETGGGPENLATRHTYKWGTGPFLDGLFSQGNFGVVTRAGIWLMPRPEHYESVIFGLPKAQDFPALIDALRRLSLSRTLATKLHVLNDFVTLAVIGQYPRELLAEGETHLSEAARETLRQRYGYAPWSFVAGLYGTRAQVHAAKQVLQDRLGHLGRLSYLDDRRAARLPGLVSRLRSWQQRPVLSWLARGILAALGRSLEVLELAPHAHAMLRGVPTEHFVRHAYMKHRGPRPDEDVDPARDGCGLLWIAPAVPFTGKHVDAVRELTRRLAHEHGFDDYLALLMVNPRTVVALISIFFDRDDPDETRRAEALYAAIRDACLERGYQQYRTSTPAGRDILDCAPDFRDFADRLKRAVDPNMILAPGRYGVGLPET